MTVHTVHSAEELRQYAAESHAPVVAEPRPGFHGRFAEQSLSGGISLSEAWTSAVRTFRTERLVATSPGKDVLVFCVHSAGRGRVLQHERVAELSPGAGVLFESRSAWELRFPAEMRSLSLHFPRELLPLRSAEISGSCARLMDPRSPTTRLLTGYLRQLNHLAGELSGERRHDAAHTALELLTMALRDMPLALPRSDSAGEVLLRMMMTHVRDHLADPGLTVEELARRHHVSVRHAYAVFARADATPGAYIREQRLLAARALLSDPELGPRRVADIGLAVGWPEPRTFERAFRRRYGMSPAAWRRERRVAGPGRS